MNLTTASRRDFHDLDETLEFVRERKKYSMEFAVLQRLSLLTGIVTVDEGT